MRPKTKIRPLLSRKHERTIKSIKEEKKEIIDRYATKTQEREAELQRETAGKQLAYILVMILPASLWYRANSELQFLLLVPGLSYTM